MAAPGTAPERFVMVGADSDAARFDRALSVPKKYGRAERARSFRISWVVAARSRQGHLVDRIRFRQGPGAAIYAVQGFRGLAVQSAPGSGGQEVQEFTSLREVSRFRVGGGDWEFQWWIADVALMQKFIVHRIHTHGRPG